MLELYVFMEKDGRACVSWNEYMPTHKELDCAIEGLEDLKREFTDYDISAHNELVTWKKTQHKSKSRLARCYGYIYCIRSGGLFKIGRTESPRTRLAKYRTENPLAFDVVLLAYVSDYRTVEGELTRRFSHKRDHGEWFQLEEEDVISIRKFLIEHGARLESLRYL